MGMSLEYADEMRGAFRLEDKGLKAAEPRNRAEWARMVSVEIKKQGLARIPGVTQSGGEIVPPRTEQFLHEALTIPDLALVEAS